MGGDDTSKRREPRSALREVAHAVVTLAPWPIAVLAAVVGFVATYVGIARRPPAQGEREG